MRYLLVGLGNIGSKRKAVLGERCVATVDPFNAAAHYREPGECATDRYDAAILAVPNESKIALMEFFLDRGKHVLVEKPLVVTPATAGDLLERSSRHGAIWYTSYNFRFEPHVIALARQLQAGTIGRVYHARMFYGNGTAGRIAGTWRDSRFGVLEDMASHLIDLTGFLFGQTGTAFRVWERRRHELNGFDHCIIATADRTIVIECSFLSWRNRWQIEVTGERGAIEMGGLTKWGQSDLVIRRRQRPSGVPHEERVSLPGPDRTWEHDIAHFEECVATRRCSYENDLWISRTIAAVATAPVEADG
jgi:scyllo-inositol 2-dehydrogenase (NADP+)